MGFTKDQGPVFLVRQFITWQILFRKFTERLPKRVRNVDSKKFVRNNIFTDVFCQFSKDSQRISQKIRELGQNIPRILSDFKGAISSRLSDWPDPFIHSFIRGLSVSFTKSSQFQ